MKRIFNTKTRATIWRGETYTVDGNPATVEPPLYLLTDVQREQPIYDEATQRLESLAPHADLNSLEWVTLSWQIVDLTAEELTAKQRATQRAALRAQWDSLPAYIKGPYRPEFEAANRLLDEGDDESAVAMIQYASAKPDFTQDQITVFNNVKQEMIDGISNLPKI